MKTYNEYINKFIFWWHKGWMVKYFRLKTEHKLLLKSHSRLLKYINKEI